MFKDITSNLQTSNMGLTNNLITGNFSNSVSFHQLEYKYRLLHW